MPGPKDKRKKKDKDYSKEQKAINKKWIKRLNKTVNKLGLSNWNPDQPTKTALKQAGTMVVGTPILMGGGMIRKKIKGYKAGGSVSRGQYPVQTTKVKFKGVF